jgi:hypothetical protein
MRFAAAVAVQAAVLVACDGSARRRPEIGDPAAPAHGGPAPTWIVDAREPGPTLPPVGRALFDFLVAGRGGSATVPFPFDALASLVEERLGGPASLKRLLVPRGRSLQRDAAPDAFFRYPRALLAVDGDGDTRRAEGPRMRLKDRLYIGYQETAALLEVISYNEAAGRFEFQVVKDYRPGGRPRVVYANRGLCMACHQNGAPLFARPPWDETNANPRIASLLQAERGGFYGHPLEPGIDVAYAVDAATDRANLLSAYQRLWNEGCGDGPAGVACRARLLTAALRYRLSGGAAVAPEPVASLARELGERWRGLWPAGLAVPNPDIANRDPLDAGPARIAVAAPRLVAPATAGPELLALMRKQDVPPELEPLSARDPLLTWTLDEGQGDVERLIHGLAEFLEEGDLGRVDEALTRVPAQPPAATRVEVPCRVETAAAAAGQRIVFACSSVDVASSGATPRLAASGRMYATGARVVKGVVERLVFDGLAETPQLAVVGGIVRRKGDAWSAAPRLVQPTSGRGPRRATGDRISRVELTWRAGPGEPREGRLVVETVGDFAVLAAAVEAVARRTEAGETDALAATPFRRVALMQAVDAELGLEPLARCCEDARGLPEGQVDSAAPPTGEGKGRFALLHRYCGECHGGPERLPPNFLHGAPAEVEGRVAQCAERMAFRLSMWDRGGRRAKTPMPPLSALRGLGVSARDWPEHADLESLREEVADVLRGRGEAGPSGPALGERSYESLRPCIGDQARSSKALSP